VLCLNNYVEKVLRNYARRYFGDDIIATSIWRMEYFNFYRSLRRKLSLAIILRSIDPNRFIFLFDLNMDIQKLPDIEARAEIFDVNEFMARFTEGFVPEVYIVEKGYPIDGAEFHDELRSRGYRCSKSAVIETLNRAFIAYGMTLNELISGNIGLALENIAYSIGYVTIAFYQHIEGRVPDSLINIINIVPEDEREVIITMLDRTIGLINKDDIPDYLQSVAVGSAYPCDLLRSLLQDDYGREVMMIPYQLLRIFWERIHNKRLMPMELFFKELIRALEDMPYAQIELRGTEPIPILRIKGPITRSIELRY